MEQKYSLGLSSFPLIHQEIEIAASIFLKCHDWTETQRILIEENQIQRNRLSTRKVASREAIKRLKKSYDWELELLSNSDDSQDKRFICLLITARQYILLIDFITEFMIYKREGLDYKVSNQEIKNWFDILGESHEEIARMKPGTFKRLINNTKLILLGGGLLEEEGEDFRITYPGISADLQQRYLDNGTSQDLRGLLKNDREIQELGR